MACSRQPPAIIDHGTHNVGITGVELAGVRNYDEAMAAIRREQKDFGAPAVVHVNEPPPKKESGGESEKE